MLSVPRNFSEDLFRTPGTFTGSAFLFFPHESLARERLQNHKTYDLNFSFAATGSFNILGLKAANSEFFYPWCLCAKSESGRIWILNWNVLRNWKSESVPKVHRCDRQEDALPKISPSVRASEKFTQTPIQINECNTRHIRLRISDVLENFIQ